MQRVSSASVAVGGETVSSIGKGLLVYLGVDQSDSKADVAWMADKIANLRIFHDAEGAMNRSLLEEGGAVLLVSQFTLLADARKGRRPSFSAAAAPEAAALLYEAVAESLSTDRGLAVSKGVFRAEMRVLSANEGPVTILLDSKKTF